MMHSATSEKLLVRASGITPLHREIEESLQIARFLIFQGFRCPAGERITGGLYSLLELFLIQRCELAIKRGHYFEIVREGTQFGGATELQLYAFIEVEGRRKIVGLDTNEIPA